MKYNEQHNGTECKKVIQLLAVFCLLSSYPILGQANVVSCKAFFSGESNKKTVGELGLHRSTEHLPLSLKNYVMPASEFVKNFLDDGMFYHGTPRVEWALNIAKEGFAETTYNENYNGAFFSNNFYYSNLYRNNILHPKRTEKNGKTDFGIVLELTLKLGVRPNVLDLRSRDAHTKFSSFASEAKAKGVTISDLLATQYGIDIIIYRDHEFVIKNSSVIAALDVRSIAQKISEAIQQKPARLKGYAQKYVSYLSLREYAIALGINDLPAAPDVQKIFDNLYSVVTSDQIYDLLTSVMDLKLAGLLNEKEMTRFHYFSQYLRPSDMVDNLNAWGVNYHPMLLIPDRVAEPLLTKLIGTFTGSYRDRNFLQYVEHALKINNWSNDLKLIFVRLQEQGILSDAQEFELMRRDNIKE